MLSLIHIYAAVERFIIRERLGTKEIREQAFRELEKAEEEQVSDKAGTDQMCIRDRDYSLLATFIALFIFIGNLGSCLLYTSKS